ncbi:hypothetical protein [Marinitenerispora sediminis]|uniref:DUF8129 domain-containing protein n=1 Tax=Marinitenerispora sediminis TaxID=1931232 RepID=A0A368TBP3_9ACTN|nr:hypothetical protein [Marinitenerispora sediminis]RCV54391.1 hypothetical protein DEF28_08240 [Marinitenerispora sediminis]RCV61120.1 hypothetical protein DEF23_03065 [Marinitenerispora sediminis]RCV62396.1 hypothetical protein DEF24_01325 [Marinitenerispora sediminis]
MSKPSMSSKISGAVRRVFAKFGRPAASSRPADLAAADADVKGAPAANEAVPADASAAVAEEFSTEAANTSEPTVTQEPVGDTPRPLAGTQPSGAAEPAARNESAPAPTPAAAPAAPERPEAEEESLVKPEEKAEIAAELDSANAETVAADSSVFADAVAAAKAAKEVKADAQAAGAPESGPAEAADLPVPNYDELTLPSVRARLRKLTIEQVRTLRGYETAHANRPEFVRMYDNRIAKLESEAAGE